MHGDNPYEKLRFNDKPYKEALDKVNSSFDASISETAQEAGMAAGIGGGNVATMGADAYIKAVSQRNASEAQVLNAKAGAETNFNAEKDFKAAEWESQKAGPLDWIMGGLQLAGSVASTVMTGGATLPATIAGGVGLLSKVTGDNKPRMTTNTGTTGLDKTFSKTTGIESPEQSNNFGLPPLNFKLKNNNLNWLNTK